MGVRISDRFALNGELTFNLSNVNGVLSGFREYSIDLAVAPLFQLPAGSVEIVLGPKLGIFVVDSENPATGVGTSTTQNGIIVGVSAGVFVPVSAATSMGVLLAFELRRTYEVCYNDSDRKRILHVGHRRRFRGPLRAWPPPCCSDAATTNLAARCHPRCARRGARRRGGAGSVGAFRLRAALSRRRDLRRHHLRGGAQRTPARAPDHSAGSARSRRPARRQRPGRKQTTRPARRRATQRPPPPPTHRNPCPRARERATPSSPHRAYRRRRRAPAPAPRRRQKRGVLALPYVGMHSYQHAQASDYVPGLRLGGFIGGRFNDTASLNLEVTFDYSNGHAGLPAPLMVREWVLDFVVSPLFRVPTLSLELVLGPKTGLFVSEYDGGRRAETWLCPRRQRGLLDAGLADHVARLLLSLGMEAHARRLRDCRGRRS